MLPTIIKEVKFSHLFGLIKIEYHVENRRPELPDDDYDTYPTKFKHYITVKIMSKTYNWTFKTHFPYDELPYQR